MAPGRVRQVPSWRHDEPPAHQSSSARVATPVRVREARGVSTDVPTSEHVARARAWRRHLHQHPELGFAEHETSEYVATTLAELGVDVVRGIGGTGVVGSLRRGQSESAIGLRADMDALALTEVGDHPHRSLHDGAMHACGHDGHMAMLLGAAAVLACATAGSTAPCTWSSSLAEEPGLGAAGHAGRRSVRPLPGEGGLRPAQPARPTPAGELHTRVGAVMACRGQLHDHRHRPRGARVHPRKPSSTPWSPRPTSFVALQTVVPRSTDPTHAAVVSCTNLVTDGARNAIPGRGRRHRGHPKLPRRRQRPDRAAHPCPRRMGVATAHGARCEGPLHP